MKYIAWCCRKAHWICVIIMFLLIGTGTISYRPSWWAAAVYLVWCILSYYRGFLDYPEWKKQEKGKDGRRKDLNEEV